MKAQSQRQLRAGELVRRAVADIIREGHLRDAAVSNASITVSEARMSPDLRHATIFVSALAQSDPESVAAALNRASGFLQKELGRQIDLKFTPKLKFLADDRFDEATHIDEVLDRPGVKRDLDDGERD